MDFGANLERRSESRTLWGLAWRTYDIQNVISPGNMEHSLQTVLPPQGTLDHRKPKYPMNRYEKKRKQRGLRQHSLLQALIPPPPTPNLVEEQRAERLRIKRISQDALGPLQRAIINEDFQGQSVTLQSFIPSIEPRLPLADYGV